MTGFELFKRVTARVMVPLQGRYQALDAMELAIRQHLASGRITAAGALAQSGIDRADPNGSFRLLRARYHIARSEWDEAIFCTDGLTSDDARHIAATALQALRRDEDALNRLDGVTDPEAVLMCVHLAISLKRPAILSRALNAAYDAKKDVKTDAINAVAGSRIIRQLATERRKGDFEAFLLTLRRPARAALLLRLHANGLARHVEPVWLQASSDWPGDDNPNKSDKFMIEITDAALTDRTIGETFLSEPDWPNQLWDLVSPELFVAVTVKHNLRPALDWALNDDRAHSSSVIKQLIKLHVAIVEADTTSIPALSNEAASLFKDQRLTLDNVAGLADHMLLYSHWASREILLKALISRLVYEVRTGPNTIRRYIADRFFWCANEHDIVAQFVTRIDWKTADLIYVGRQLSAERRQIFLSIALDHLPHDFALHHFAIKDAALAEDTERLQAWLDHAKLKFSHKPNSVGRLLLAAEMWAIADSHFDQITPHLEPMAKDEWLTSLLKRGRIDAALKVGSQGGSNFNADLEKIKQARTELENVLPTVIHGPADIVSALKARAANPDNAASGIIIVTSTLRPGGAERQVSTTAVGLSHQLGNKNVTVLARDLDPSIQANFFASDIKQAGIPVIPFSALKLSEDPLLALLPQELQEFSVPLFEHFRQERPEVVHLWQDRTALGGAFAAILAGVPKIVISLRSTRPDARRRHRPYQHALFQALIAAFKDRIIIVNNSHFGAADYEDWLDLPAGYISVIHNGFDLEALRSRADAPSHVITASPCIGWVGRFTFEKRPELWTDTAIALAQGCVSVSAIAAGDGPMREFCAARVRAAEFEDRIIFTGVQRPIEPLMAKFDLLLLTSEREGLPNVLVEAQALGVPVVTLDAGGAAEAVDDGHTGLVLPVDMTPAAIAAAVQALFDDPVRRANMSARAKTWAETQFSQTRMIEQTLSVYDLA